MSNSFVPGTGVVKCDLEFLLNNQKMYNSLFFVTHAPIGTQEFATLAGQLVDWWNTYLRPIIPPTCGLNMIRVTDQGSPNGAQIQYTVGLPLWGTSANHAAPGNVTIAVRFTTAKRGRSYTGRNFLPGVPREEIFNDVVQSAFLAAVKAAYEALLPIPFPGDAVWVVASKIAGKVLRTTLETTAVEGVSIDPVVDSQKRRLVGRGR